MGSRPRILGLLEEASPAAVTATSAAIIAGLGFADAATGAEVSSSVFYALPVGLAAWYAGWWEGVALGILAAGTWYGADRVAGASYSAEWIPFWNAAVRLAFFLVIARLLVGLRSAHEALRSLALTDTVTGLANGRSFQAATEAEVVRSSRYGHPVSVLYIDLDGFKQVNDRLGHHAGDQVLRLVATTLKDTVRVTDLPARLGGDEFAVLLTLTGEQAAREAAEKVRGRLEAAMEEQGWKVGFSMGVVTSGGGADTAADLVRLADLLMYEGKSAGKGRTVFRSPSSPEQPPEQP